jgi:hypothetical protein
MNYLILVFRVSKNLHKKYSRKIPSQASFLSRNGIGPKERSRRPPRANDHMLRDHMVGPCHPYPSGSQVELGAGQVPRFALFP